MENACLRIKFKTLFQKKTIDNSICCLEIVPVVSCIQNLDKLIWNQSNNLIEYIIPMTYKVVLQRQPIIQADSNHTSFKTYHSCVDLLLTSSNSLLGCAGSGDISKRISDTFILKKCFETCMSKDNFMHDFLDECNYSDNDVTLPDSNETTNSLLEPKYIEKIEIETNTEEKDKVNVMTSCRSNFLDTNIYGESLDKILENEYPEFDDITQRNIVNNTFTTKSFKNRESTRVLSLSPICSVNTHETSLVPKILASKAVACKIHESQGDLVLLGCISSPSVLSDDYPALSNRDVKRRISPKKIRSIMRVRPEMRVVECVQYMEQEILPLKLWLNDIKRKCTALGIEFNKKPSNPSVTITNVSACVGPEITTSDKIIKSNRAVYSMEFNEYM